ncbi:hypothetical protein Tco_0508123, partial [Tanacetum coccineum]
FDQYQPPQFPDNHQFPQETSKEILQAHDDLMEAIQAFLKEYDHIPPNEKCMALLLAEERFLKIKQAMEEEQNQPKVLQELLLKLINNLQILKGIQQEKKETAAQSFIPYWNFSMIDDEEARDNFMKDVCPFLRKFSHALMDKQYRQEDIQELMSKLLEDVRNISEEFLEYINCPSWNRPLFYFDDDDDEYIVIWRRPKAITPDEPIEELDNSISMGDEHLDTIPSVENLVPIPSEFESISDDTCDVPVGEDSSIFNALSDHSEILSDSNDDGTSSDDFEDIEYISSGSTTTRSDYSLSDYEAFYLNDDHIEEKSSGSTTTHADFSQYDSFIFDLSINPFPPTDRSDFYHEEFVDELAHIISPPEYDCFYFKNEPELGDFTMDVVGDIYPTREPRVHVPNVLPTHPTLDLDLDFILLSEPLFAYIVWIFLAFLTYPITPPYLLSCGNEDTIFDPGIST